MGANLCFLASDYHHQLFPVRSMSLGSRSRIRVTVYDGRPWHEKNTHPNIHVDMSEEDLRL
jgi:hypothetical protein